MNLMLIYIEKITPRSDYIFHFLVEKILGVNYRCCTDSSQFLQAENCFKLNYSRRSLPSDLQIIPHNLLFESDITSQAIQISTWKELPIFFSNTISVVPFDIISASFYLLVRYEEYLPYQADDFGRFPHKEAIAFQASFLNLPLIDLWMLELRAIMLNIQPKLIFLKPVFSFTPTYDIDIAYSYLGKGFWRNLFGAVNDTLHFKIRSVHERLKVLRGQLIDPYDAYPSLDELHKKYRLKPIYFFLVGDGGKLDRNLPVDSSSMQSLIANSKSKYEVGVHPSVNSHKNLGILQREVARVTSNKSRFHYIKYTLPQSYRNLIQCGITDDYSMGYGSINGFRASTSYPFKWFDVEKNEATDLLIHSFCYMECNSRFEQKDTAEEAFQELVALYHEVKKVNGNFIMIWHNFSLGSDTPWNGWKEMYEKALIEIA